MYLYIPNNEENKTKINDIYILYIFMLIALDETDSKETWQGQ